MKRINNLFDKIYSIENINEADRKARKGKSKIKKFILIHDNDKEAQNLLLALQLKNGTYRTSKYKNSIIYEPKKRIISKLPYYPDRIAHHAIMNIMKPNKLDMTITEGKVVSVGFPHMDLTQKATIGLSQMVVDVTIELTGKTATYTIPENLSITYAGDIVLSTDKNGLAKEVESMKNTAEKIIESVPRLKEVIEKSTALLADINPVYKEKKETELRFAKIEESINRMESTVTNFINQFNNGQSNSNTSQ